MNEPALDHPQERDRMANDKFNPLSAQRAIFESQLSPTEKLVAFALLGHWSRTTATYPSLRRLAEWSGYDRATVQRAVASLRNKGAIETTEHPGRSTTYNLEPLLALPKRVEPVAENDRSQRTTGRTERPHRSHRATAPVAQSDDTGRTERPEVIHRSDPEKKSQEVIPPRGVLNLDPPRPEVPENLPANFERAIRIPLEIRCKLAIARPDNADFADCGRWPEVVEAAEVIAKGLGAAKPRLGNYHGDAQVRRVIELLAAGFSVDELRKMAPRFAGHSWLAGKKSVSALTLSIANELNSAPQSSADGLTDEERTRRQAVIERRKRAQEAEDERIRQELLAKYG